MNRGNKNLIVEFGIFASEYEARSNSVAFIDVRTIDEWNNAHIDGFKHIPLDSLLTNIDSYVDDLINYSTVMVLCRSGVRSLTASEALNSFGVNAKSIDGGILKLIEMGYKTVTEKK